MRFIVDDNEVKSMLMCVYDISIYYSHSWPGYVNDSIPFKVGTTFKTTLHVERDLQGLE